ncbi:MAG: pyridoxamine 5'-phosphate oxidase family protein [Bdellovibrionales bacterium]|nr:pyridoxamine 5'-phosphate oxidase family protein [Bdellovibrionales bacterium]
MNIRNSILSCSTAVLSTHSHHSSGFPFGSVVSYDVDEDGRFILYLSYIAEHYRNLSASPKASLFIFDPYGTHNPLAHWRITALCTFSPVPANEVEAVAQRYEQRFPGTTQSEISANFTFVRALPEQLRWIEGFGSMGWVSGVDFSELYQDPIVYYSRAILCEIQERFGMSLKRLVEIEKNVILYEFIPVAVDSESITFQWGEFQKRNRSTVRFPRQAKSQEELYLILEQMIAEA